MKPIEPKTFQIPALVGISSKNIEEHLKLYAGYVKNANLIMDLAKDLAQDPEKNAYIIAELHRKYSFEYNGIKNHEYYFGQLEGGAQALSEDSALKAKAIAQWGSWDWMGNYLLRSRPRYDHDIMGGRTTFGTLQFSTIFVWNRHVGTFLRCRLPTFRQKTICRGLLCKCELGRC